MSLCVLSEPMHMELDRQAELDYAHDEALKELYG